MTTYSKKSKQQKTLSLITCECPLLSIKCLWNNKSQNMTPDSQIDRRCFLENLILVCAYRAINIYMNNKVVMSIIWCTDLSRISVVSLKCRCCSQGKGTPFRYHKNMIKTFDFGAIFRLEKLWSLKCRRHLSGKGLYTFETNILKYFVLCFL